MKTKMPVVGMIERQGNVKAFAIEDTKSSTITPLLAENVQKGSTIYSDEWHGYKQVQNVFPHKVVPHSAKEFVRGEVHTNSIESFWAIIKRAYIGTFHYWSKKHLSKYIKEFTFRQNNRKLKAVDFISIILHNGNNKIVNFGDIRNRK